MTRGDFSVCEALVSVSGSATAATHVVDGRWMLGLVVLVFGADAVGAGHGIDGAVVLVSDGAPWFWYWWC